MFQYVLLLCTVIQLSNGLPYPQGCNHGGESYKDGNDVAMADPCVKCRCVRGVLVCRLRVCNPQPHPPPPGCLVLTRRSECCQRLVCNQVSESAESNLRRLSDDMMEDRSSPTGCMVNGSLYAEGSAMDSSTRCHYCYCIKGQQHCVRPQCLLSETNCTPSFTTDSCCPSKYTCNRTKNDSTTTTSKPSAGCEVEGRFYPEGGLVPRQGGDCENCYCLEGQLRCEPVICSVPVNRHCVPVITTGHCCPTSYNCSGDASAGELDLLDDETQQDLVVMDTQAIDVNHLYVNSERSITGSAKNSENNDFSILTTQATSEDSTSVREERETTTLLDTTTTYRDETTTLEEAVRETTDITSDTPSTTGEDTTIPTTTLITGFTDAEERLNTRIEDLTTTSRMEEITTIINSVSNDTFTSTVSSSKNSSINNLNYSGSDNEKSFPSEIEAILNKTKLASKEEDYDYDYNEPSLPPSLPNLRIIPFVAADAVVDDRQEPVFSAVLDKSHASDDPHFFDGGFSPPAETEGGFVPKEPLLDGPFYESKFDSKYHNNGVLPLDLPPGTHSTLPSITEGTKTPEEEKCQNGGHSYRHGELLTKPSACHLCICYYGKILCQEPKCPVPDPGCRLLRERDHSTCCRKILCNSENAESPTRVVDHVTPASHLPPFTVADVIVTPDPFRDVIRTEPAPDLSSLIGEIMPFFWDQSTASTTPVYLTTTSAETTESAVADTSTASSHTTIRQETADVATFSMEATTSLTSLSTSTHVELADDNKNETKPKLPNDYDYKEVKEEGPAEEEFSFESVLSILFGGETSTEKSAQRTKTQVSHNVKPNNAQPPNMKPINNTEAIKLYPNQILEHRSDEDINELTSSLNNTLEKDHIQQSDTVLDDILEMNKSATGLEYTTKTNPITKKPIDKIVHSTTIRNLISKVSTKRYGTKYSTTHSKPIPTRPTQAANLPLSVPDPGAASGLLKLAGCNIYGRMYRVGRIISELSGPCLECMCTEVGVQCRPLKC